MVRCLHAARSFVDLRLWPKGSQAATSPSMGYSFFPMACKTPQGLTEARRIASQAGRLPTLPRNPLTRALTRTAPCSSSKIGLYPILKRQLQKAARSLNPCSQALAQALLTSTCPSIAKPCKTFPDHKQFKFFPSPASTGTAASG